VNDLEILRKSFVAFLDGLWWGLRNNTGPLSMYEGYARGFKQMGQEIAERLEGQGPSAAAEIASRLFSAIGLDVVLDNKSITVKRCPVWERILERGLEFAFHVEEICWIPMLEGIGSKTGATPEMETSLRLVHIEQAKIAYKKNKAKSTMDKGQITAEEYEKEIVMLDKILENAPTFGLYRFK